MNEVAEAAGVTKPVLYQHFASKQDLFDEVVTSAATVVRTEVQTALNDATGPREKVEAGFASVVDILASNEAIYRVLFDETTRVGPDSTTDLNEVERILAESLAANLQDVDVDDQAIRLLLAHAIVGMIESALRHWYANPFDIKPADLAEHLAALAWAGLRGSAPAR